jgi:hypothetical protein
MVNWAGPMAQPTVAHPVPTELVWLGRANPNPDPAPHSLVDLLLSRSPLFSLAPAQATKTPPRCRYLLVASGTLRRRRKLDLLRLLMLYESLSLI